MIYTRRTAKEDLRTEVHCVPETSTRHRLAVLSTVVAKGTVEFSYGRERPTSFVKK